MRRVQGVCASIQSKSKRQKIQRYGSSIPAEGIHSITGQRAGGIISLAQFAAEHREAVEYDLLTRTGYKITELGSGLSWGTFGSFLKHIGADSATARDVNPELAEWASRAKTNAILADIFDMLAMINANLVAVGSRKKAKAPQPYPRPGAKEPEGTKHYGRQPLPVTELREWLEKKRSERNG